MDLPALPPLHPLCQAVKIPTLPAPPPLPAVMPVRIYSQGRHVTPWYPMRIEPCSDRPGVYEVQWSDEPETMEYWDGKRWPGLTGRYKATGWRGLAHAAKNTTTPATLEG